MMKFEILEGGVGDCKTDHGCATFIHKAEGRITHPRKLRNATKT